MIYSINYDLKRPGQNYEALYKAIKELGEWWHFLESTWLVDTNLNAEGIYNILSSAIDKNDFFLVIGVTSDYQGWLPKEAWEWINSRKIKMAA